MAHETKIVYAAVSNTDRSKGCGEQVYMFGETQSTAIRIGRGQDVQGYDCKVVPVEITKMNEWMIPFKYIRVHSATQDDLDEEAKHQQAIKDEDTRQSLIDKLRHVDLTYEEVAWLVKKNILVKT